MINSMQQRALEYVRNTNGGATVNYFIVDFEPVGEKIWKDLKDNEWVREDDNLNIFLTAKGIKALEEK